MGISAPPLPDENWVFPTAHEVIFGERLIPPATTDQAFQVFAQVQHLCVGACGCLLDELTLSRGALDAAEAALREPGVDTRYS